MAIRAVRDGYSMGGRRCGGGCLLTIQAQSQRFLNRQVKSQYWATALNASGFRRMEVSCGSLAEVSSLRKSI